MGSLDIRLFGGLGLSRDGAALLRFPTRESETIFSFLILNRGRLYPRSTLVGSFYSDKPESVARKRLRTTIWRIRSVLEPDGITPGSYLTIRNQDVGFNTDSDYWLDVQDFESRIATVPQQPTTDLTPNEIGLLDGAVSLYRGDLLEGLYEDWCLWQQERLKLMLLNAIERLMRHYATQANWASATLYAQQLLSFDALREHIHRDLMRFYYHAGNRPAALGQYEKCAVLLRNELGIEPMRETTELRDAIRSEGGLPRPAVPKPKASGAA